jgi:hypothetical protein
MSPKDNKKKSCQWSDDTIKPLFMFLVVIQIINKQSNPLICKHGLDFTRIRSNPNGLAIQSKSNPIEFVNAPYMVRCKKICTSPKKEMIGAKKYIVRHKQSGLIFFSQQLQPSYNTFQKKKTYLTNKIFP